MLVRLQSMTRAQQRQQCAAVTDVGCACAVGGLTLFTVCCACVRACVIRARGQIGQLVGVHHRFPAGSGTHRRTLQSVHTEGRGRARSAPLDRSRSRSRQPSHSAPLCVPLSLSLQPSLTMCTMRTPSRPSCSSSTPICPSQEPCCTEVSQTGQSSAAQRSAAPPSQLAACSATGNGHEPMARRPRMYRGATDGQTRS